MEEEVYCVHCQKWMPVDHDCFDSDEAMADDSREREQFFFEGETL